MSLPLAHADTLPEPEPRKPRGAHLRALNTPPDAPDAPEAPEVVRCGSSAPLRLSRRRTAAPIPLTSPTRP